MSVRSTALRLSIACRRAMPDASIVINHFHTAGGRSSYVNILYRGIFTKARVSDHGIGPRRYYTDQTVSLYLRDGAAPGAWELWLGDLAARYAAAGGALPPIEGLFAPEQRAG